MPPGITSLKTSSSLSMSRLLCRKPISFAPVHVEENCPHAPGDSHGFSKNFRAPKVANCEEWPADSLLEKSKARFRIRVCARMTRTTEFLTNTAGNCAD